MHNVDLTHQGLPVHARDVPLHARADFPSGTTSPQRGATNIEHVEAGNVVESSALETKIEAATAGEQGQRSQPLGLDSRHQCLWRQSGRVDDDRLAGQQTAVCRGLTASGSR